MFFCCQHTPSVAEGGDLVVENLPTQDEHVIKPQAAKGSKGTERVREENLKEHNQDGRGSKPQAAKGSKALKRAREQIVREHKQALYSAAKGGDVEAVRKVLRTAGQKVAEECLVSNESPSAGQLVAEEEGKKLRTELVNMRFDDKYTALMTAAEAGHIEVVKLLLAEGADAGARNAYGQSALHLATLHNHSGVVVVIVGFPEAREASIRSEHQGMIALEWAAQLGHSDIVRMLLDAGSDVNHLDPNGRSALHRVSELESRAHPALAVDTEGEFQAHPALAQDQKEVEEPPTKKCGCFTFRRKSAPKKTGVVTATQVVP